MKKKTINITVEVSYSSNGAVYGAFILSLMKLLEQPNLKNLINEKDVVNIRLRPIECNEG